jgi:RHS repeat-associated protein
MNDFVGGVPQNAIHYFLSGRQVVETREGSPAVSPESLSPKYQYIWSPRYIDALIMRDEYSGGVLQGLSRIFYLSDANYNVTAIADIIGAPVERYDYTPYGETTIYEPDWSDTLSESAYDNTVLYTGRTLDTATGLYYYRARYYDAALERFISRDPIEYNGGDLNLYRYVGDSPMMHSDPSGLSGICSYKLVVDRVERQPGSHFYSPWWLKWRCVYRLTVRWHNCSECEKCPRNGEISYSNVLPTPIPGLLFCPKVLGIAPIVGPCSKK